MARRSGEWRERPAKPAARGFSLVEVLVAIVVLAVGLLGLAGLQVHGMQINQGSAMRSQAAILAEDLADRMRGDYTNAQGGSYYGTYTAQSASSIPLLADWIAGLGAMPPGPGLGTGDGCSGKALPCAYVASLSPPPNSSNITPVEIVVYWNDTRASLGAAAGASAPTSMLGSYTMIAELSN